LKEGVGGPAQGAVHRRVGNVDLVHGGAAIHRPYRSFVQATARLL
jgi:hypothetical protein